MKTEEKAKAYDEALKRAEAAINIAADKDLVKGVATTIFPELKEREDEIHRKWILEYLYDGLRKSDEQFKGQFKSAIDWLEKQKERKPEESKVDVKILKDIDLAIRGLYDALQPKVDLGKVVMIDNIVMSMVGEGYNDGYKTRPFYEEVVRRINARKEEGK